jgi:glucokinase
VTISYPWLLADIGGTNVRFCLQQATGQQTDERILHCIDYPHINDAISAYLDSVHPIEKPIAAALAVAAPPDDVYIKFVNQPWAFYVRDVQETFRFQVIKIINDFTAVALSIPRLENQWKIQIGDGTPKLGKPISVLGAGTGLGVSTLVPAHNPPFIILTNNEGGHFTLPPMTDRESDVLGVLRQHFNHVSAERVLSGAGLVNIYQAICTLDHIPHHDWSPSDITRAGLEATDIHATETLDLFCAFLGTAASNLCITVGAYGGVYLAGGIIPKLGDFFHQSRFRKRFETKGRFSHYLESTPTYLITHPLPAMVGLKALVMDGLTDTSL